jgi:hypothetical protein
MTTSFKHVLSLLGLGFLLVFAFGSSDTDTKDAAPELYMSETYNPSENPSNWTAPIQSGQNLFNINMNGAYGEERLSLYISMPTYFRTNENCSNSIKPIWGYATSSIEQVYDVNGRNIRVKESSISILDLSFLEAASKEGNQYMIDTMMSNPSVKITSPNGKVVTIKTDGFKQAHRALILFCRDKTSVLEDAL